MFGKSSRSIIQQILDHPGEKFDVAPFVNQRCKHPIEEIQATVDGAISKEQAAKLKERLVHIDEFHIRKANIEKEIQHLADPYSIQLDLIRTVRGFPADPMTVIAVFSEIRINMSVFPTAKHLVSWAGCCPRNDKSNKAVKSTRISQAGSYLKPLLIQVANTIVKSDKYLECKERYRRIKAHRGHKNAIIAVCRMLLIAIWHILSAGKPYTAEGYLEERPSDETKVLTMQQAHNLLKSRGYVIKDDLALYTT